MSIVKIVWLWREKAFGDFLNHQWQAALLSMLACPNMRYPKKAPNPTASMIHPLYVMNRSLFPFVSARL